MAANANVVKRFGNVKPCAFAASFNSEGLPVWDEKAPAPKADAPAKKEDDDDLDLFGGDDEETAKAIAEAKEKAQKAKKPKKVVIEKSIVLFEVKPWGEDTDLDVLAKDILAIEMDGLMWKTQYKKEPIAYGISKLIIGVTIEDAKVSVDDLQEKIEGFEEQVQSVDIAAFNKV